MRKAQAMLIERIKAKGSVNGEIVKVDTFLNHFADVALIKAIGGDIAAHFKNAGIDKIITVEASGIIPAQAAAFYLDCDFIYAKKKKPLTMKDFYTASSYSFTKQESTDLYVSKEVLKQGDRLLFIDDFYAKGNTLKAIENLAAEAGAVIAGKAVVIDKQGVADIFSILTLDEIKAITEG